MANTKSAEKAARQADKHRARNVTLRSKVRSAIRKVNETVAAGNKDEARKAYQEASAIVDSLVNKRLVHRNKASRHKSRLSTRVKSIKA